MTSSKSYKRFTQPTLNSRTAALLIAGTLSFAFKTAQQSKAAVSDSSEWWSTNLNMHSSIP